MSENCKSGDCPMENRISALEDSNKRHGETHREIFGRLNTLDKEAAVHNAQYKSIMEKLDSMDNKHDRLAEKMESIEKDNALQTQTLGALNEKSNQNSAKLSEIEAKPGKRWEGLAEKAIWAVAAAVIAFLLARIGL